jgi:hypothetical protein
MASAHSDLARLVASLRQAARQGDWKRIGQLVVAMREMLPPQDGVELGEYLGNLREVLVIAKASRSHVAARLHRVRVAADFIGTNLPGQRHDFVDSPGS